jgi:two-component system chemotaxis sensor kinase CheA
MRHIIFIEWLSEEVNIVFASIRFNIRAKILLGYLAVILGFSISILMINSSVTTMKKDREFITGHDFQVHELSNEIEKNIIDMEDGQRSYALTGDSKYLTPYNNGAMKWKENYNKLYELVSDNPAQQKNLQTIKTNIENWVIEAAEPVIVMKNNNRAQEIIDFFNTDPGKNTMDQVRSQLLSFRTTEQKLTELRSENLIHDNEVLLNVLVAIWIVVMLVSLSSAAITSNFIVRTVKQITASIKEIVTSNGDLSKRVEVRTTDEIGELAGITNQLLTNIQDLVWVQTQVTEMATNYQGITDVRQLTQLFINKVSALVEAPYGVIFLRKVLPKGDRLARIAAYAGPSDFHGPEEGFQMGEGLIGQCALENRSITLNEIPDGYVPITSGLGKTPPRQIIVLPIVFEKKVLAVMELASLTAFTPLQRQLFDQIIDAFGAAIHNALSRTEIENLYSESQAMTEELQVQTEEHQTQSEELQVQAEALRLVNEQLEEQNLFAEHKSFEIEKAKEELELYAEQLKLSSQYKSEFLANMSHELRTPLNSLLILSEFLMENANGTLNVDEQEYARIINGAGNDLLNLISDILDLSKVEAGKLEIEIGAINLTELPYLMERNFAPVAAQKELQFRIIQHPGLPYVFFSDEQRLQQVLKNLLSNAFKFTEAGTVTLSIRKVDPLEASMVLPHAGTGDLLAFSVSDTGIGIPANKRSLIFEAFQQADGKTERKYGGTGLGLSISREFASLLGGTITLQSEEFKGSTFTLYIPCLQNPSTVDLVTMYAESSATSVSTLDLLVSKSAAAPTGNPLPKIAVPAAAPGVETAELPAEPSLQSTFVGKRVLIVDDDERNIFALTKALELQGMQVSTAKNGKKCLEMLDSLQGEVDIILMDIMMPELDGYQTMTQIRMLPAFHELPIIALTAKAMKYDREKCLEAGASDYISKPLQLDQLFSVMRVWLSQS